MLNIPVLISSQIESFENDGFLIVKDVFSPENIKDLTKWSDEVLAMPEKSGKQWVYHEKSLKENDV